MYKRSRLAPMLSAGLLVGVITAGLVCLQASHAFSKQAAHAALNQPAQEAAAMQPFRLPAAGPDTPRLNLRAGRELATTYAGPPADVQDLEQGRARPLSLAASDFDEDGVADLVSGCAMPAGGILILHAGNGDALYPNTP